jgi:hypothetical protein
MIVSIIADNFIGSRYTKMVNIASEYLTQLHQ